MTFVHVYPRFITYGIVCAMTHAVQTLIHGAMLKPRALLALMAFVLSSSASAIAAQHDAAQCRPTGPLVQVPGLSEASGLALSRRVPGRLWTHNDSGEPVVVALDARGSVTGRIRLMGAAVEDWEAIAVGPCGTGSCLHVGDIGDNAPGGSGSRSIACQNLTAPADRPRSWMSFTPRIRMVATTPRHC